MAAAFTAFFPREIRAVDCSAYCNWFQAYPLVPAIIGIKLDGVAAGSFVGSLVFLTSLLIAVIGLCSRPFTLVRSMIFITHIGIGEPHPSFQLALDEKHTSNTVERR